MFDINEIKSVIIAWLEENPKGGFENFYTHFATLCEITKTPAFDKDNVLQRYRVTYLRGKLTNRKV